MVYERVMAELADKVVIVTGATRGIGLGTARVLAREGARVVVTSIEGALCDEIASQLPGGLERHAGVRMDVSNDAERAAGIAFALKRFGRIDGLVNNAGVNFDKAFLDTSLGDWQRLMAINLESVFDLSRRVIAEFVRQGQGGAIVNITSVHTLATYAGSSPYAASKAAINMFTKGLANEFASQNIRVNCVAPGLVRTEIWANTVASWGGDEAACMDYWKKNIPLGRIIESEEIGESVSFLLSDRARAIGGAVLYVDGGLTGQLIASR